MAACKKLVAKLMSWLTSLRFNQCLVRCSKNAFADSLGKIVMNPRLHLAQSETVA